MTAGLAATPTEWFIALEAGDTLPPGTAAAFDAALTRASEPADFLVGAARLVALGIDDTVSVDAPDDPAALDPAHPVLRSICWSHRAASAAGGFDLSLTAAVRYDLWLKVIAGGGRARHLPETLVCLSVEAV
jgi:hypothetical protein